jgi:hypothetical protein
MVLNWIGGGKPDHPMADMKRAQELIGELPQDSYKALDEVTFWLDSLNRTEGFKLDQRFELVDLIDRAAKGHQRKLSQEYLAAPRLQKFQENRMWKLSFEYWKTLGAAYGVLIEQFQSGASGAGSLRNVLPVVTARALRALKLQLKWVLLRYGTVEDRIWADLARFYQFGEDKGFAVKRVEVYPADDGESSVEEEFVKALMLSISSADSLLPQELDIAERTCAHFGRQFQIGRQAAKTLPYYFDLAMRKPPARMLKGTRLGSSVRYFGAGEAMQGLHTLIHEIREKDGVPSDVHLGGSASTETVVNVMRHLVDYWADQPPARGSERRKVATRMTVVPGFGELLRRLEATATIGSFELHETANSGGESWIVENVSDGGYGAIVPQVKGDWLKVGALIAFRTETSQYWGAGILRRITRDQYQQRRVGIQALAKIAIRVTTAPPGGVSSFRAIRDGDSAVLLSTQPDKNGEITMLTRVGSYSPTQLLEMRLRDKVYLIEPTRMIEGGEDYDWARYKIVSKVQ